MITANPRFRHVVFADTLNFSRAAVDHAPDAQPSEDPPPELEDQSLQHWLLERAGISPASYRPETLARRLPACLRAVRASSPVHARLLIERNHSLLHEAISAVIIGVSSFFRDANVFAALRDQVIPQICERPSPRIWSIGCADGCELYSNAILLAEQGALKRSQLLGTDCRLGAIRASAAGVYAASQIEHDIPSPMLAKYFDFDDRTTDYYIIRDVKQRALWRCADVLQVQEPGPWDLILCRNMAMYMRADTSANLWRMLEKSLRPGGYLVLGKAERPQGASWLSSVAPCIYRRDQG